MAVVVVIVVVPFFLFSLLNATTLALLLPDDVDHLSSSSLESLLTIINTTSQHTSVKTLKHCLKKKLRDKRVVVFRFFFRVF